MQWGGEVGVVWGQNGPAIGVGSEHREKWAGLRAYNSKREMGKNAS